MKRLVNTHKSNVVRVKMLHDAQGLILDVHGFLQLFLCISQLFENAIGKFKKL